VSAHEVTGPSIFFGTYNHGIRLRGSNHFSVSGHLVADFIHGGADRVNIAMRVIPDSMFIVGDVIAYAAIAGSSPLTDQVLNKRLLERSAVGNVCVIGIVSRNVRSVSLSSTAGIGIPGRIAVVLSTVFLNREAPQNGTSCARFCDPI